MADACECICSYQWAMRRLMQILNQAQTYCTEDDCQDPQGQVWSEIHALLVRGPLGASWCEIFGVSLVLVRCGPTFQKNFRSWCGAVRVFKIFSGPGAVRSDFFQFCGSGAVRSEFMNPDMNPPISTLKTDIFKYCLGIQKDPWNLNPKNGYLENVV